MRLHRSSRRATNAYNGINLWASSPVGYTVGPKYWGLTFFTWPPDPNNDWRQHYFPGVQRHALEKFADIPTPPRQAPARPTTPSCLSQQQRTVRVQRPDQFAHRQLPDQLQGHPGLDQCQSAFSNRRATAVRSRPAPFVQLLFYTYIPTDVPSSNYTWANGNSSYQLARFQRAFLEGIHRLHDGRVDRSVRQHPGSRHLHVQLRPRFHRRLLQRRELCQHFRDRLTIYTNGLLTVNSSGTPSTNQSVSVTHFRVFYFA